MDLDVQKHHQWDTTGETVRIIRKKSPVTERLVQRHIEISRHEKTSTTNKIFNSQRHNQVRSRLTRGA